MFCDSSANVGYKLKDSLRSLYKKLHMLFERESRVPNYLRINAGNHGAENI